MTSVPREADAAMADEAHRGTGDYAYAQVVRYMMQHNPHHRILALTATPGGKPEVVQDIVDALHISHIEIRSETDSDLKKYLHTKHEQEHFVEMTEDIIVLRDALSAVMVVCPSQQSQLLSFRRDLFCSRSSRRSRVPAS